MLVGITATDDVDDVVSKQPESPIANKDISVVVAPFLLCFSYRATKSIFFSLPVSTKSFILTSFINYFMLL